MVVTRLELRDFRNYEAAELELAAGLDRRGRPQRRRQDEPARGRLLRLHRSVAAHLERARAGPARRDGRPGGGRDPRRGRAPTASRSASSPARRSGCASTAALSNSLSTLDARPLVSVFMPERLELVKGAPAARRAHLDQFVAALWPARAAARRSAYSRALAQRNALLGRIRAGLRRPRRARRLGRRAGARGDRADGGPGRGRRRPPGAVRAARRASSGCRARPSCATGRGRAPRTPPGSRPSSAERRQADLERGFTAHGPHRDELAAEARRRASCAPTARRASSGSPCWRSCSPSASCSPPAAAARR